MGRGRRRESTGSCQTCRSLTTQFSCVSIKWRQMKTTTRENDSKIVETRQLFSNLIWSCARVCSWYQAIRLLRITRMARGHKQEDRKHAIARVNIYRKTIIQNRKNYVDNLRGFSSHWTRSICAQLCIVDHVHAVNVVRELFDPGSNTHKHPLKLAPSQQWLLLNKL